MMNLRILLADDHTVLREGIRRVLSDEEGMEVVAEAEDGHEAVRLAIEKAVDMVLMDISMPKLNGIDATHQILRESPNTKIIILSMHSDRTFIEKALKAGVYGYLLKNSAVSEVVTALKMAGTGKRYLSPQITSIVVEDYVRHMQSDSDTTTSPLTLREREILQHLAEGETSKEIASSLNLSERTVEVHRKNIMQKLNLHSLSQLTKYAIKEGLTSLDI